MANMGYSYKKLQGPDNVQLQDLLPQSSSPDTAREQPPLPQNFNFFHRNPKATSWAVKMLIACLVLLSALSLTRAAILEKKQATSTASASTTKVPQYFQTTPEIFTGMFETPPIQASHQVANWKKVQLQLALRLSWLRATPLPSAQPRSLQTAPLRPRYPSLAILRMRVFSS